MLNFVDPKGDPNGEHKRGVQRRSIGYFFTGKILL
jgi:hypothetical protein